MSDRVGHGIMVDQRMSHDSGVCNDSMMGDGVGNVGDLDNSLTVTRCSD